jgi:ABC-2 type transport system ATP-binding protein
MTPAVSIHRLSKVYGDITAVRSLSLTLYPGDIFGFIGPNGAGKTTTIRMLATLIRPTSGRAEICGFDTAQNPEAVRSVAGYMPDTFGVYDDIKVWEYLDFFAAAYRVPKVIRPKIIDDVLALTDLTAKKDAFVESLSKGMKQRLCLAKTLVHDPKVLLLDEPAAGLDPRARIEIKELLKELGAMGKTIIISSHILPEMADFCNKIGVIERGELIVSGEVDTIVRQVRGEHTLEIQIFEERPENSGSHLPLRAASPEEGGSRPVGINTRRAVELAAELPEVGEVRVVDGCVTVGWKGEPEQEWRLLKHLVDAGIPVRRFAPQATDLEDVFMRVTKGLVS